MGEKVLVVQSAPAPQIEQGLDVLLERGLFSDPDITVFCRRDDRTVEELRRNPLIRRLWVRSQQSYLADLKRLRGESFDAVVVFLTGERGYLKTKILPFLCKAKHVVVVSDVCPPFVFKPRSFVRFLIALPGRLRRARAPAASLQAGEKVLLIQTAAWDTMARAVSIIRERQLFSSPEFTLFSRSFQDPPSELMAQISELVTHTGVRGAYGHLRRFRRRRFDGAVVFFSGERGFWKAKIFSLMCGARRILVFNENLDCFFFSASRFLRFLSYRLRHGSPRRRIGPDVGSRSEKVLLIQSAEPEFLEAAIRITTQRKIFSKPVFTAFVRNDERCISRLAANESITRLIPHTETQDALRHLISLRREKYDALVVFLTGDPSYWKIKYFAFMCGAGRILVFNENLDCFFFNLRDFYRHLKARLRQRIGAAAYEEELIFVLCLKLVRAITLPFRFVYLLAYVGALRIRRRLHLRHRPQILGGGARG